MIDILNLKVITLDIINYYKSNPDQAKKDYDYLLKNVIIDETLIIEGHHILPRCLGGDDSIDNIIRLNYSDHIKAHMLLYAIHPDTGLSVAFELLINTRLGSVPDMSIDLDALEKLKEASHSKLSEFAKARVGDKNAFYGKHHTEETKSRLSKIRKENYTKENHPRYGVKLSEETRKKISKNHADVSGSNNPASRKLIGPDGYLCGSIKEAMDRYKKSRDKISKNLDGKYKFI